VSSERPGNACPFFLSISFACSFLFLSSLALVHEVPINVPHRARLPPSLSSLCARGPSDQGPVSDLFPSIELSRRPPFGAALQWSCRILSYRSDAVRIVHHIYCSMVIDNQNNRSKEKRMIKRMKGCKHTKGVPRDRLRVIQADCSHGSIMDSTLP
jgi:hypothetical protein